MRSGPFARAAAMFSAVLAAARLPFLERESALAAIPPYRSRGKGLGLLGNKHSKRTVAQDKRDARKARNRRRP